MGTVINDELQLSTIEPGASPQWKDQQVTGPKDTKTAGYGAGQWVAIALSAIVFIVSVFEKLVFSRPPSARPFGPAWLPIAASLVAIAGVCRLNSRPQWFRFQRALLWIGLLLMVWAANGIPFDLLNLTGLIRDPETGTHAAVDWQGMMMRILALAATVALARIALARPPVSEYKRPAAWYGYAAFAVALPYPVIRTIWAFGGMLGLSIPGAGGVGFIPWLACIPWLLAAALSLLLVTTSGWKPRRFLLISGWTATTIVAMVGPTACWTLISQMVSHHLNSVPGMSLWVPCLFYGSWFLWPIIACAATRSYQLRSVR